MQMIPNENLVLAEGNVLREVTLSVKLYVKQNEKI